MRLTSYERGVQREIEKWQQGDASLLVQAMNWAMSPVDWVVRQVVSADLVDQADGAVAQFLGFLSNASEWTYAANDILKEAKEQGLDVEKIEDLRDEPLEELDPIARGLFTQNTLLAAVEGGGTGLGGAVLIAADIPLLFTINFRLIQQIGATYGYVLRGPEFEPLVLAIFNVAASGGREAKNQALREITVAAAAFANDLTYKGRVTGTFKEQNRHLPREIAKNIVGRKLAQTIPVAGAAVGAGINYWFTSETAEAALMLFRALYIERKERL
jgi:uncharacterized protein (DUF697 family)